MIFQNFVELFGGLALFLLGMNHMSDGLENACGNKMKKILEKVSSNRFIGILVGCVITCIIQSSSATTVMVVGFVNAGMMTLTQAIWIIMGANIGTTITGQLVALDIGVIAYIFAIVGVVMVVFIKKQMVNEIGKIFAGFGVLFIGMDMMSASMYPLRESELFINIMSNMENPFLGVLFGTIFTAIIQSSSASVGILQGLAMSEAITLNNAVYILFGMNIGTCVTALIASSGTKVTAKRTTLFHFMFNIIGTIIFSALCYFTKIEDWIALTTTAVEGQIANMHTIFNIVTCILLIPFGPMLARLAEKILKDKETEKESLFMYLSNDINIHLGNSALHLDCLSKETERMFDIAKTNVIDGLNGLLKDENYSYHKLETSEILVDNLFNGIASQITTCIAYESNSSVAKSYSCYLNLISNIERLSDHAMNLGDTAEELTSKNINLNIEVVEEIKIMKNLCVEVLTDFLTNFSYDKVKTFEVETDRITKEFRYNMAQRLENSICKANAAMLYTTILIDFERIGDHLLNIAEQYTVLKNN